MKLSDLHNIQLNEAVALNAADVKIEDLGDNKYKVSVAATSGPLVAVIRHITFDAIKAKRIFKSVKTKSGLTISDHPSTYDKFKANGVIITTEFKDRIQDLIDNAVKAENKWIAQKAKSKAEAPARKKEMSKIYSAKAKERKAEQDKLYGAGTVARVKIKQPAAYGDDGYQWTVFVDGREIMNGLTKSSAEYYQRREWENIAKANKLGKWAK